MIFSRTTFHPLDNGTSVYHAAAYDAAHSTRPMRRNRSDSLIEREGERERKRGIGRKRNAICT